MSKDRFRILITYKSHHAQDYMQLIEEAARSSDVNVAKWVTDKNDLVLWLKDGTYIPVELKEYASARQVAAPEMETAGPPPQANLLLRYVLPRKHHEHIVGDLEEAYYTEWLPAHGPREARRLYWWHASRSIVPMLWTGVKRSTIITAILGAADWLRDRLG
jgi:hypothetical protein